MITISLRQTKHLLVGLILNLCFFNSSPSYAALEGTDLPGEQVAHTYSPGDKISGYLVYLPLDYYKNPNKDFPMVVFFHGAGERGTNLNLVKRHGPPKLVEQGKDFPCIIISPQARYTWDHNNPSIDAFIEKMKKEYRVDDNRMYVTGLSMGGAATWNYTIEYSHKVAASVPICGWGQPQRACEMKNVPVWAAHNQGDPQVGVGGTLNMLYPLRVCANPKPIENIFPGGGHDAWTRTYNDERMWEWMFKQSKNGVTAPANTPPVADAGSDKSLTLPQNSIVLSGTGKDNDGSIANYAWTKTAGPGATLNDANQSSLKLTNLVEGNYTFKLTVTDNDGAKDADLVNLIVSKEASEPSTTDDNGVIYAYYEGQWSRLPDFQSLRAIKTGSLSNFLLTPKESASNFAFTFDSKIKISTAGTYTFYTNSDDGSKLFIDGKEVVNNDGLHGNIEKNGKITLTAGLHDIRVLFFEKTGSEILGVKYEGPGIKKQAIPSTILFKPDAISNTPPMADAGSDKSLTLPQNSIVLSGTGKDNDGSIANYAWTKTAGPGATLNDANQSSLKLTNLVEGNYTFKLTVTDNDGAKDADLVNLIVSKEVSEPSTTDDNGVTYAYYEGQWSRLPDFQSLRAIKTGSLSNFLLTPKESASNFAFTFDSKIKISAAGTYTFYTNSDDGSKLFIDGKEVVNNDGLHGNIEKNGKITLTTGLHDIRVLFFEKTGSEILGVKYEGPGIKKQAIPSTILFKPNLGKSEEGNVIVEEDLNENNAIFVNFNHVENAGSPWNNTGSYPFKGKTLSNLKDTNGQLTSVNLTFLSEWGGAGITAASQELYQEKVTQSYYWTVSPTQETLKFSGLDKSTKYSFTFYGYKNASGNRTTEYSIGSKTVSLNASNNVSQSVVIPDVYPNADGEILIEVKKDKDASFGYLNSIVINYSNAKTNSTVSGQNSVRSLKKIDNLEDKVFDGMNIKIYPNPIVDNFHIELFAEKAEIANIKLADAFGKVVIDEMHQLHKGGNLIIKDIQSYALPAGLYILIVEFQNGQTIKHKLLKK